MALRSTLHPSVSIPPNARPSRLGLNRPAQGGHASLRPHGSLLLASRATNMNTRVAAVAPPTVDSNGRTQAAGDLHRPDEGDLDPHATHSRENRSKSDNLAQSSIMTSISAEWSTSSSGTEVASSGSQLAGISSAALGTDSSAHEQGYRRAHRLPGFELSDAELAQTGQPQAASSVPTTADPAATSASEIQSAGTSRSDRQKAKAKARLVKKAVPKIEQMDAPSAPMTRGDRVRKDSPSATRPHDSGPELTAAPASATLTTQSKQAKEARLLQGVPDGFVESNKAWHAIAIHGTEGVEHEVVRISRTQTPVCNAVLEDLRDDALSATMSGMTLKLIYCQLDARQCAALVLQPGVSLIWSKAADDGVPILCTLPQSDVTKIQKRMSKDTSPLKHGPSRVVRGDGIASSSSASGPVQEHASERSPQAASQFAPLLGRQESSTSNRMHDNRSSGSVAASTSGQGERRTDGSCSDVNDTQRGAQSARSHFNRRGRRQRASGQRAVESDSDRGRRPEHPRHESSHSPRIRPRPLPPLDSGSAWGPRLGGAISERLTAEGIPPEVVDEVPEWLSKLEQHGGAQLLDQMAQVRPDIAEHEQYLKPGRVREPSGPALSTQRRPRTLPGVREHLRRKSALHATAS